MTVYFIVILIGLTISFGVAILLLVRNKIVFQIRVRANQEWFGRAKHYNKLIHYVALTEIENLTPLPKDEYYKALELLEEFNTAFNQHLDSYEAMIWQLRKWSYEDFTVKYIGHLKRIERDINLALMGYKGTIQ